MQNDHDEILGDIPHEPIDDATALALRDGIVAAMIADACQWMPPFRLLALAGSSPFVHMAVSRNDPPWWWRGNARSWQMNALAGNITQFLVKYPPPQQPYNPWKPKKMTIRTRPLDMGGPRDVWRTWTPYTNAAELGLLR